MGVQFYNLILSITGVKAEVLRWVAAFAQPLDICHQTWQMSILLHIQFTAHLNFFSKRENPCKYILIYTCKLLWSNIWYWMCEWQNMFENDRFLHSHWLHKSALPPIFRGLLLSRPRYNFAMLILRGSAFVDTLKQSLEVSLQNVQSTNLTVTKQIQKKFT